MARRITELDEPDAMSLTPVDVADERGYLLEARRGFDEASVVLGAEQVAVLADRLSAMVDELERRGLVAIDAGVETAEEQARPDQARQAIDGFWAQTLLIGWDESLDRIVLEAWSHVADDGAGDSAHAGDELGEEGYTDDDPSGPDVVRIRLTPRQAQRFTRRATATLSADRPTCPLCGASLHPAPHRCPPIEDAVRDE